MQIAWGIDRSYFPAVQTVCAFVLTSIFMIYHVYHKCRLTMSQHSTTDYGTPHKTALWRWQQFVFRVNKHRRVKFVRKWILKRHPNLLIQLYTITGVTEGRGYHCSCILCEVRAIVTLGFYANHAKISVSYESTTGRHPNLIIGVI